MRSTDRPTLRVGIPQGPDNPESFSELVVWQNTLLEWDTRIGDGSFIQSKVLEHSRFGSLPVSLSATKAGDSEVWRSSVVKVPGLEHEILLKLTPTEFRMQVEENRAKEWRPHLMQIHGGRPDPMLSAVFIKSSDGQRWDSSPDLSEEQYAAELIKRKAEGFYPAQVVSYVENGQVHFIACWLGMTVTGPK